jgi:hypothetical protein
MSSVPISVSELELIAEVVARDLLEQWAIDDRFKEEDMVIAAQNVVDDTIFVINSFMEHLNNQMMTSAEDKKLI